MSHYVRTDTYLDKILAHKVDEIAARQRMFDAKTVRQKSEAFDVTPRDFIGALRRDTVALIAEVKKASPSRGVLLDDFDPAGLGRTYAENGAAAISVLTDKEFFQGELSYLNTVRSVADVPVLRKDFIIDAFQLHYMRATQIAADAVLLIVAALDDAQLKDLHALITEMGMAALVEVHDEAELERALKHDCPLIGINNRDLRTFEVDLETTARLAAQIPESVTLVAESGVKTVAHVQQMGEHGAHAILVGEGLVTAEDTAATVQAFSTQPRASGATD